MTERSNEALSTIVPPVQIAEKDPEAWSKDQAKQYFEWLVGVIPSRTTSLLQYFEEFETSPPEVLLTRLGKKVGEAVEAGEFVEGGKPTNAGFALAADLGLLVARLLLEDSGVSARWVLDTRKRSVNFNHAVLQGGGSKMQLNPVTGSITEFSYALKNGWNPGIWSETFTCWRNMFSSSHLAHS